LRTENIQCLNQVKHKTGEVQKIRMSFLAGSLLLTITACSAVSQGVLNQEWSENYALEAQCASKEMIDGKMDTSAPISYGNDVMVVLPEKKNIDRILIYNKDLKYFKVLAEEKGKWKPIKIFKGNREKMVEITTHLLSDKIMIQIWGKAKPGEIQEIELYGLSQEFSEQITKASDQENRDGRAKTNCIGTQFPVFTSSLLGETKLLSPPTGLSGRNWRGEKGVEFKLYALNLFGASVDATALAVCPAVLTRYTKKSDIFYPYTSVGGIGGFVENGYGYDLKPIRRWIYGIEATTGVAVQIGSVEVSLDLVRFFWINFSGGGVGRRNESIAGFFPLDRGAGSESIGGSFPEGIGGFIPVGAMLNIHIFF